MPPAGQALAACCESGLVPGLMWLTFQRRTEGNRVKAQGNRLCNLHKETNRVMRAVRGRLQGSDS